MEAHKGSSVVIVDDEHKPIGIITSVDLIDTIPDNERIKNVMSEKVYTVPQYDGVHIAARIMMNHNIHHVTVTHEGKVTGMVSSFDLLQLVAEHRFVMKNPPK
jgi:signal-transduction protein with cAMP-binding, CBS, and nucleotidyltransferase domain